MSDSEPRSVPTVLVAHSGDEQHGSNEMTLATVQELLRRGWRVVLAGPNGGPLAEQARRSGAEIVLVAVPVRPTALLHPAPPAHGPVAAIREARRMDALITEIGPSVVYVATLRAPLWIAGARSRRVPVLCHVRHHEVTARRSVRRLLALPLLHATSVLVSSEIGRSALLDVLPSLAPRTSVVLDSIPTEPPTPSRRAIEGPARLVSLGPLSPHAGADVAVEALHQLLSSGTDAELTLVGGPVLGHEGYRGHLQQQVQRLGLSARVLFASRRDDVSTSLAEADVALAPAREDDAFRSAAVDVLVSGHPAVVSGVGRTPEEVEGFASAVLVAPGDAQQLAEGVRHILRRWAAFRSMAAALAPMATARHAPAAHCAAVADHLAGIAAVDPPLLPSAHAPRMQR